MPWKETHTMDLKIQMITDWLTKNYYPTELARVYGVSRKTVYKWINRYQQDPETGLKDRSRAPHTRPNAVPDRVKQIIIETKLTYPHLGPKKVMTYLRRQFPDQNWPANSTAGNILKQAGLVRPKRRKARVAPNALPFASCDAPNSVWSADYKGDFKLGNRNRCYPLTVSDNYSRYLLACQALPNTGYVHARAVFERLFYQYGLPAAIRIDNGAPFASTAFGGLSCLSAWWVRLGIRPERIEKGKPNQNGRHERMHRSLKDGAINPACYSFNAQQKVFDRYLSEYNDIRSHESLDHKVPADVYRPSNRLMPSEPASIEYDSPFEVRKVRHNGEIKWQGRLIYLSQVLAKQPIGFKQISQNRWGIYYSFYLLGFWNQRKQKLEPVKPGKHIKKSISPAKSPETNDHGPPSASRTAGRGEVVQCV
jgi:transposase InsO family protein/transposase-like protein